VDACKIKFRGQTGDRADQGDLAVAVLPGGRLGWRLAQAPVLHQLGPWAVWSSGQGQVRA